MTKQSAIKIQDNSQNTGNPSINFTRLILTHISRHSRLLLHCFCPFVCSFFFFLIFLFLSQVLNNFFLTRKVISFQFSFSFVLEILPGVIALLQKTYLLGTAKMLRRTQEIIAVPIDGSRVCLTLILLWPHTTLLVKSVHNMNPSSALPIKIIPSQIFSP